jgi:hypothetical protein
MGRKKKEPEETYEVTVWDYEGNIVKKLWEATYEEAEALREQYADDHSVAEVVVEER